MDNSRGSRAVVAGQTPKQVDTRVDSSAVSSADALKLLGVKLRAMEPDALRSLIATMSWSEMEAVEAALELTASPWSGAVDAQRTRWHDGRLDYQHTPCLKCHNHETWRETGPCVCAEPDHSWEVWVFVAGRGTGKTLTGSEWVLDKALSCPGDVGAVIAPTHSDLRRITVEGPSGLVSVIPPELVIPTPSGRAWNEAASAIELRNGSTIRTLSAEHPDRIRGENLAWAWADELAAWNRLTEAWEILEFALRIGEPQALVTTTPRPLSLLRELIGEATSAVTRAATTDNPHLAERALKRLLRRYAGTRVGRQELEGEILDEVEGALTTLALIDAARAPRPQTVERIVVGVDPSGGRAEIGIVVVARVGDDLFVLEDATLRGTPAGWGSAAVAATKRHEADRIAAERNYGGDMVEHVLHTAPGGKGIAVNMVTATRGKLLRAEFLASMYEQGRVHHVQIMPELEDQLITFVNGAGQPSPDRLDALVWAAHDLMTYEPGRVVDFGAMPVSLTRDAPSVISR